MRPLRDAVHPPTYNEQPVGGLSVHAEPKHVVFKFENGVFFAFDVETSRAFAQEILAKAREAERLVGIPPSSLLLGNK